MSRGHGRIVVLTVAAPHFVCRARSGGTLEGRFVGFVDVRSVRARGRGSAALRPHCSTRRATGPPR